MAKQFKEYKRKNIRCLIIEDFETNKVFKVASDDEVKIALEKYSENEVTKIYNPTQEQKKQIQDIMQKNVEGEKLVSQIDGIDMLSRVVPMLTDIEIDLDKEEDREGILSIIEDPDEVFTLIGLELNYILMKLNLEWIENLKLLSELPDEIINTLSTVENNG